MRRLVRGIRILAASGFLLAAGEALGDFRALYAYGMLSSPSGIAAGIPGVSESAAGGPLLAGQFLGKPIGPVTWGAEIGYMPRLLEYDFEYRDPACPSRGKEKLGVFPLALVVEARMSGIFFQGRIGKSLIMRKGSLIIPNPADPVNSSFDEVYARTTYGGAVGYRVGIPRTTLAVDLHVGFMIMPSFTFTEFGTDAAGVLSRVERSESFVIVAPGIAITGTNPAGPKPTL